jgi:outer membrane protein assembly factor BamB
MRSLTTAVVALSALASGGSFATADEALFAAVRGGDVAAVRSRLDAGADPNAANRHGTTVLAMAADAGQADVARLLVERGADVDARDRFFRASPLDLALRGGHMDLALWLLPRTREVDGALAQAVESKDERLLRAVLATGRVEPLELEAARRAAADAKAPEALRRALEEAPAKPPARAAFSAAPERLARLAGRYRAGQSGEATVAVQGDGLVLRISGQPDIVARPISEDRFESASGDATLEFGGRGGLVESLRVNRNGDVARLVPLLGPAPGALGAGAPSEAIATVRGEPRPWPSFRGGAASGNGDGQGAPTRWEMASGTGVRFSTPIPGLGLSSPIVWGRRIFVTSAVSAKGDSSIRTGLYGDGDSVDDSSDHSFRLYALDADTGRIAWDREVHRGRPGAKRHLKSSQANATPATDGTRVVVLFGSAGVLAAYDFDGQPLWRREIGVLDCGDEVFGGTEWGHASSPLIAGDEVIVQADHKGASFLAAYRLSDGTELWRTPREEASTWSTPVLLHGDAGDEVVTNGRTVRGYDPRNGSVLWTLAPNSQNIVSSPVVGDGLAFVTGGYPPIRPIYAIRAGQRGDISPRSGESTSAGVAWSRSRGGSYIPTPLFYRDHLYTLNNNGVLACYRAKTGEQVYEVRIGDGSTAFAASPVAADGRLYITSESGEVHVVRAGPEQSELARNDMGEVVMATPAISGGLLVVRTVGHVVGLAEAAPQAP